MQTGADRERLAYSPQEAAAILGVSVGTLYRALESGALASVKLGRRLVSRTALEEILSAAGAVAAPPAAAS